jgi:DNA-binding PadR family transcriptional regulator
MTSTPGLGKLELAVLMAVATLGDEAYGLGIRHEVSARRKHDYSVGAIYTTLGQLERKGLVKSWTTEPLPGRGGRSRRPYKVSAQGQRVLREARQLAAQIQHLVARTRPA